MRLDLGALADAPGARIKGSRRGQPDGLTRLVELLHVEKVFDAVADAFEHRVPYRAASPGLRLVGADDEAAAFRAALALAIEQMTADGPWDAEPLESLLPDPGTVTLEAGSLADCRDQVTSALTATEAEAEKAAGFLRRSRRADGVIEEHARAAGAALGELREQVRRLFRAANTAGGLTDSQQEAIRDAGLRFSPAAQAVAQPGLDPDQMPGFRAITEALDGGDTLPLVQRRLDATAEKIKRYGSAAYLPQVDTACPAPLPQALSGVDELPARVRRGDADAVRQELKLDDAGHAVAGLIELVRLVANREWSPAAADSDELDRARIALGGIQNALAEYAPAVASAGAGRIRLSESLRSVLRALVGQVLKDEYGAPGATGQDTLDAAERRTRDLLKEWSDLVQAHGLAARPKFAASVSVGGVIYTAESDLAAIREALQADPRDEMWQLCEQDDVSALNVGPDPVAVRFAPRQNEEELGKLVPRDTRWLSAGARAGLLRLVPLHYEVVAGDSLSADPSQAEQE